MGSNGLKWAKMGCLGRGIPFLLIPGGVLSRVKKVVRSHWFTRFLAAGLYFGPKIDFGGIWAPLGEIWLFCSPVFKQMPGQLSSILDQSGCFRTTGRLHLEFHKTVFEILILVPFGPFWVILL